MPKRRLAQAPRVQTVALSCAEPLSAAATREPWYRISNQDNGEPVVEIFGEIGWDVWADEFVAELRAINAPQMTVRISSPGGSIFEGMAIYNAILDHPAAVNVVVDGVAASAASFIAQAGDHVLMNRGAQMMIHEASGVVFGNASDMESMAVLLNKLSDEIAGVYAARAGGTVAEWRDLMRAETWMTGPEAVDLGLADATAPTARRGAADDASDSPAARFMSGFRSPALPRNDAEPEAAQPVTDEQSEDEVVVAAAPVAEPDPAPPEAEPAETPEPDPDPPTEIPEPEAPVANDWGFVIARLTTPPPSADDQWNRLKEALL